MDRIPSRKLRAIAASCIFGGVLVACGSNPPRPSVATVEPPVATFVLPERAADLSLDKTNAYDDPAYGTQYTYGIKAGEPFDVYIYPIAYPHRLDSAAELDRTLDLLVQEFAYGVDQAIASKIYSAATVDEDARIEVRHGKDCLPGRYRRMILEKEGEAYASEMYGFAIYGSFVKVRVSRPVDAYSATRNRAFVDAFMQALEEQINLYISDPSDAGQLQAQLARIALEKPATCTAAAR